MSIENESKIEAGCENIKIKVPVDHIENATTEDVNLENIKLVLCAIL